jgi:hypothetical protein
MQGLFVSSVAGHAVTRFGSGKTINGIPFPGLLIGAERDLKDPTKITWNEDAIVHIPEAEASEFHREYRRAIRDGALKERTEAEYVAQNGGAS